MKKSAFPVVGQRQGVIRDFGISQRLYVATKIAAGLISDNATLIAFGKTEIIKEAFNVADELIKQDKL